MYALPPSNNHQQLLVWSSLKYLMVEILLRFHVPWPLFEQVYKTVIINSNMAHLYNYKTGVPNWGSKQPQYSIEYSISTTTETGVWSTLKCMNSQ